MVLPFSFLSSFFLLFFLCSLLPFLLSFFLPSFIPSFLSSLLPYFLASLLSCFFSSFVPSLLPCFFSFLFPFFLSSFPPCVSLLALFFLLGSVPILQTFLAYRPASYFLSRYDFLLHFACMYFSFCSSLPPYSCLSHCLFLQPLLFSSFTIRAVTCKPFCGRGQGAIAALGYGDLLQDAEIYLLTIPTLC